MVFRRDSLSVVTDNPTVHVDTDDKISGDIWRAKGAFAVVQPRWSDFLIRLSIAYAGLMGVRYVLTMIRHPEMRWAGDIIPIAFHFVIAGFILALGNYHQVTTNP
jgi:hypothetical protein